MNALLRNLEMQSTKLSYWKMSLQLQSRTLHIHWLQNNCASSKPGRRNFSSSFPVRYIPKKPSNERDDSSYMVNREGKESKDSLNSMPVRYVPKKPSNECHDSSHMLKWEGKESNGGSNSEPVWYTSKKPSNEQGNSSHMLKWEGKECQDRSNSEPIRYTQKKPSNEMDDLSPILKWEGNEGKNSLNREPVRYTRKTPLNERKESSPMPKWEGKESKDCLNTEPLRYTPKKPSIELHTEHVRYMPKKPSIELHTEHARYTANKPSNELNTEPVRYMPKKSSNEQDDSSHMLKWEGKESNDRSISEPIGYTLKKPSNERESPGLKWEGKESKDCLNTEPLGYTPKKPSIELHTEHVRYTPNKPSNEQDDSMHMLKWQGKESNDRSNSEPVRYTMKPSNERDDSLPTPKWEGNESKDRSNSELVRYTLKRPSSERDDFSHMLKWKEKESKDSLNSKALGIKVSDGIGYEKMSHALKENFWTDENPILDKSFMFEDGRCGLKEQNYHGLEARDFEHVGKSEEDSSPVHEWEVKESKDSLNSKALRTEVSHDVGYAEKGYPLKENLLTNGNQILTKSFVLDDGERGLKEQAYHDMVRAERENKDCLNSKALKTEVSHGVGYVETSNDLEENFLANENQMLTKTFLYDDEKLELEQQSTEYLELRDIEGVEEPEEDSEEPNTIAHITKGDAEKLAIKLLARRGFTAVELAKKLRGKKVPHYIIEAIVVDFQTRGFLNDSLLAETYSRSRWSSSGWGPQRIKQALVKKGVSQPDSDKALNLVFHEGGSDEDEQSRKLGMSKLALDQLLVKASKQWLKSRDVPIEKQKTRIIGWLKYRGFSWAVISFILKRLESQYPSQHMR